VKSLSLHARCLAYARAFPQWPDSWPYVTPTGRWIYGHWFIGGLFKNRTRYYGAYPRTYPERVRAMFPDVRDRHVLHLFSGSLPKGQYTRLDCNPRLGAELVGSAYELRTLARDRRFELVMADPPYSAVHAKKYGTRPVNKARVMRVLAETVPPGAHVVWLDWGPPIYRSVDWHAYGSITVVRSTNQPVREATFFQRRAA
jgi:hypothetical protein